VLQRAALALAATCGPHSAAAALAAAYGLLEVAMLLLLLVAPCTGAAAGIDWVPYMALVLAQRRRMAAGAAAAAAGRAVGCGTWPASSSDRQVSV
jgi:hypothetical protein